MVDHRLRALRQNLKEDETVTNFFINIAAVAIGTWIGLMGSFVTLMVVLNILDSKHSAEEE